MVNVSADWIELLTDLAMDGEGCPQGSGELLTELATYGPGCPQVSVEILGLQ